MTKVLTCVPEGTKGDKLIAVSNKEICCSPIEFCKASIKYNKSSNPASLTCWLLPLTRDLSIIIPILKH